MGRTIHVLLVLDVSRSADARQAVVRSFDDNPSRASAAPGVVHCEVGDTLVWTATGRVPTWGVSVPQLEVEEGAAVFGEGPSVDPRSGLWQAWIGERGQAVCRFELAANGAPGPFTWELAVHAAPAPADPRRVNVGFIARPL